MSMDYGRLRERQRGLQLPLLEILSALLLLAAIILAMLELVQYSNTKDSLPTDLTIAGIPVGGLSENDARARWESAYNTQPIQLYYGSSLILLDPVEIGFHTNSDAMLAEARAQSAAAKNFWVGFWNYLERRPVAAVTVPLSATYDPSDLRVYLENLARRYDSAPGMAGFDLNTLSFPSGRAGMRLDLEQAMTSIDQALYNPEPAARRITLPMVDIAAQQRTMDTLKQAILTLTQSRGFEVNGADTAASVYIMNLATGEEVNIQADVPYSAVSTIKIPIMINLFRTKLTMDVDSSYLLTESILCSNNASSNLLMQVSGLQTVTSGDANESLGEGLNQVSCTAQSLGAEHTYISAPLWVGAEGPRGEWPVCRPEQATPSPINTNPDPYSQTTPEDMGTLLTEIYDCANSGSGLMTVYPDDITQTECQQMLEVLSGNRIDRLMELGVPLGTRVAHKNGWGPETTGDAGIVFSPGADYVFVMYTWERDTDGNNLPTLASWELIEEVSRLVYNYFNPDGAMYERRQPLNAYGAVQCVTVNPQHPEYVDLNNINAHRVDENRDPLPDACYGGQIHYNAATGTCLPWDNWGQTAQ